MEQRPIVNIVSIYRYSEYALLSLIKIIHSLMIIIHSIDNSSISVFCVAVVFT